MRGCLLPDVGMAFGAVQVVHRKAFLAITRASRVAYGIKD